MYSHLLFQELITDIINYFRGRSNPRMEVTRGDYVQRSFYYRISDVLNTCISMIVQYKRRHSIEERRDLWQLKIRLD